jgi:hypothetical protein
MLGLLEHLFGCVLQDEFEECISMLLTKGAAARRRMLDGSSDSTSNDQ